MNSLKLFISAVLLLNLSACVTVLDATIDGPIKTDPQERSFGTYIDDKNIKTIVSVNIKKASAALDEAHVNVHVYNGVVLLTGEVQSQQQRDLASATTRKVHLVRQVYNELQIQPKTGFFDRAADDFMQTKLKTRLLFNKDIDSDKVKIIVENDVVYLMGLLTKVQTEKITDVVRKQPGVKKVVRAVEYIDD